MAVAIACRSERIDHGRPRRRVTGQADGALGLAGAEARLVRRQHARRRLVGERTRRLRRHLRPEQGAEERQAVDAHDPTDQLRMLLGQQHGGHPAHRMSDDRRSRQSPLPDVTRQLIGHRLHERSVAVHPRLPREAGQLHQMDPMCGLQPLRLGSPHVPRRAEAGDQNNVGTRPDHLDRQSVRDKGGRGIELLGHRLPDPHHKGRGTDGQSEKSRAQPGPRLEEGVEHFSLRIE